MTANEDLEEKKLLGSGGYAIAKLTEQEENEADKIVELIQQKNLEELLGVLVSLDKRFASGEQIQHLLPLLLVPCLHCSLLILVFAIVPYS